jgi:hypothetical protein
MRWVAIYAAGVFGLCALGLGCAEEQPREGAKAEPARRHADPSHSDVAVFAAARFGAGESYKPVVDVVVVNVGEEPITILEKPDIVIGARYVSGQGSMWLCPSWGMLLVVGQNALRPGECAIYRWASDSALQQISVLRLTVVARWHSDLSGEHTTSSRFSFAPPVDTSRIPPALPLQPD